MTPGGDAGAAWDVGDGAGGNGWVNILGGGPAACWGNYFRVVSGGPAGVVGAEAVAVTLATRPWGGGGCADGWCLGAAGGINSG